jgi:hypothetical protein
MSDAQRQSRQPEPMVSNYPHLFRLMHWLSGGSAIVLFLTGLSLHAMARPDWSIFRGQLPWWLWQGRVGLWHILAAAVFAPTILGALIGCWRHRPWRRGTLVVLFGSGVVLVVTGLLRLEPPGSVLWSNAIVFVHASLGLVVMPSALLWHGLWGSLWKPRLLIETFRPLRDPRWLHLVAFLPLPLLTTWILLGGWPLVAPWRVLSVKRIPPAAPVAAAVPTPLNMAALPWLEAPPLRVWVANGTGFRSGQTPVVLRALHDGRELFVRAEWDDPTEDRQYRPWKKTADGWERLNDSGDHPDVYYEDKFSLVFPIEPDWRFNLVGCTVVCHGDSRRSYGYKGGPKLIDCWHWKAVRTDSVGQVDDQYWTVADFDERNVGRRNDPKDSGGYEDNGSEDGARPEFLAGTPEAAVRGAIHADEAVPYTPEAAAALPAGTIVPSIMVSAFVGDRGDVRCQANSSAGRWTLHLRRLLDTGSPNDAVFVPGDRTPFGCAAFDGTSDRHAYALPVYWMMFDR